MMIEEHWKTCRHHTKELLNNAIAVIKDAESFETLTNAEKTICDHLKSELNVLLLYWDERSKASKAQFVEGGKDEKS